MNINVNILKMATATQLLNSKIYFRMLAIQLNRSCSVKFAAKEIYISEKLIKHSKFSTRQE